MYMIFDESLQNRIVKTDTCWLWTGAKWSSGYGYVIRSKKAYSIHKLSYLYFKGELKENECVLHTCDVRNCCNPDHLFKGTRTQNMEDKINKNRLLCGFDLPQTRLSDEDIKLILRLHTKGMKQIQIAKKFNVTQAHISRIINNKVSETSSSNKNFINKRINKIHKELGTGKQR